MATIGTTNIKFSEIYNIINDTIYNGTESIPISSFRNTDYVGGTVPNTGAITIGTHFKNKNFALYDFTSHTFESCASSVADTRMGPTLANCISEYGANSPWNNTAFFNVVSGIQEWTVPETSVYTISATGASGGHYSLGSNITEPGGYGAVITGNFTLTRGDKIKILVGRKGDRKRATQWTSGGGGGGGTFVLKSPYNSVDSVLVVAGGGGGNHDWNVTTRYVNGGQTSLTVSTNGGVGNINGWGSGGGGGLIGDGSPSAALPGGGGALSGAGGKSFINGGIGGVGGYNSTSAYYYYNNHGGFGGGGGNGLYAGGGGGGMSGGATTIRNYSPYMGSYGGGSYNTGTSQSASSSIVGADGEDGDVEITMVPYLYEFTSHTFTNCGATGRFGPTLANCTSTYSTSWINETSFFNMISQGIQEWTVPENGTYTIEAWGSDAYNGAGGFGAKVGGDFELQKGDIIKILVGQRPFPYDTTNKGGAGGTFVVKSPYNTNESILVIAGGGGGGQNLGTFQQYAYYSNAKEGTSGGIGTTNNTGGTDGGYGNEGYGEGGAGFLGQEYDDPETNNSFINGGSGSLQSYNSTQSGFGGGGRGGWSVGGGGGGGYSGGGGSNYNPHVGGGGGSYNNGTNKLPFTVGVAIGKVIITKL